MGFIKLYGFQKKMTILFLAFTCVSAIHSTVLKIQDVYFAQTHILRNSDKYFRLVAGRDALIKVNITSLRKIKAVPVYADVSSSSSPGITLKLKGPSELPFKIDTRTHSFDNSFTAVIPGRFIEPGMRVTVKAGDKKKTINKIEVGAPNRLRMRYFGFRVFESPEKPARPSKALIKEMQAKLPITGYEFIDSGDFNLPAIAILPQNNQPARIAFYDTKDNWHSMTFSMRTLKALAFANGEYHTTIYAGAMSIAGGGWGGGNNFAGIPSPGIIWHELGHALSLSHNNNVKDYPYRGDWDYNAGPTWAYDPIKKYMIPARIQPNNCCNVKASDIGKFKRDPQWGGGSGDQEEGYQLRHHSDRNNHQIQLYFENNLDIKINGQYYRWDDQQKKYKISDRNKKYYPVKENVRVYTLFGSLSVTKSANMVYDPLEYTGNLIQTYDPTTAAGLKGIKESGFCHYCNVTVKVTQGGRTNHYAIFNDFNIKDDPRSFFEMKYWALNLPVSQGKVSQVTVYYTPQLTKNGFPERPRVLSQWPDNIVIPEKRVIAGKVWRDKNRNGTRDSNETGIGKVVLILNNEKNKYVAQTVTSNDGSYAFSYLKAGRYRLVVAPHSGYKKGQPLHGLINVKGYSEPGNFIENDDNGKIDNATNKVISGIIDLRQGKKKQNRTISFGFHRFIEELDVPGPAGYTYLGKEGETKTLKKPAKVAYGARGRFNYKNTGAGRVTISNAAFGDACPGVQKYAFYKNLKKDELPETETLAGFTFLGKEGETKTLPGKARVAYGIKGKFIIKEFNAQEIRITNSFFGKDPAPGKVKKAFYKLVDKNSPANLPVEGPAPGFSFLGNEGDTKKLEQTARVAYGENGVYIYRTFKAGKIKISNKTFGKDPVPNVQKSAWFKLVQEQQIAPVMHHRHLEKAIINLRSPNAEPIPQP